MHEELTSGERKTTEDTVKITYYFTVIFVVIGTILTLFVLNRTVENLSLFVLLLSIWGGGLPIGFVGIFIDYQVSKHRLKQGNCG